MKQLLLIIGSAIMAIAPLASNAAADPYIESDGTCGISTGYRMNGDSRVEVDFSLTTTDGCSQWRIFGSDSRESSLITYMYIDGDLHYTLIATPNGLSRYTTYVADTSRHTAIFDLYRPGLYFVTGGVTNWASTSSGSFAGRLADLPLSLFGRYANAYATKFELCAKERIYGVKIYEQDVLVHDFVPCLKDGVACFKDLVAGGFIVGENVAAFTAGGDAPTYIDDAYVSTAANASGEELYIDTGYTLTPNSAVELDYAIAENAPSSENFFWYLFYGGSDATGYNYYHCYFNQDGMGWSVAGNNWQNFIAAFPRPSDDKEVRRKFKIDGAAQKVSVETFGFVNIERDFTVSETPDYSVRTLKIAANRDGSGSWSPLKIYGCKIWEGQTLVRDFVPYVANGIPGMRDTLTGAFIDGKDYSGGGKLLAYGGAITGELDAYIQSAGTANISTGHKMNGYSRVEVDFALSEASDYTQWRVFGTDGDTSFKTWLYIDGDSHYSMVFPWGQKWTTHTADTIRHTAIIDVNHGWAGLVTGADVRRACGLDVRVPFARDGAAIGEQVAAARMVGTRTELPRQAVANPRNAVVNIRHEIAHERTVFPYLAAVYLDCSEAVRTPSC